ncbi:SCF ubiquitin ligase complex subunit cdc4 [Basidiobolus ranarum]|uniref:SCF ubiquitin ligase complex subunit cdc4 n=1 Tax=Basidiobolus ranarum TaxID=34480 RepID=A0ABR2VS75_9FUNG
MNDSNPPSESQNPTEASVNSSTISRSPFLLSDRVAPIITTHTTTTTTTETNISKLKHPPGSPKLPWSSTEYPLINFPTPTALKIGSLENNNEISSSHNLNIVKVLSTLTSLTPPKLKRNTDSPDDSEVVAENITPTPYKRTRFSQSSNPEISPQIIPQSLAHFERTSESIPIIREDSASLPSPCRSPSSPILIENPLDLEDTDRKDTEEMDQELVGPSSKIPTSFPNLPGLLSRFDSLPAEIQQAMLFQMLKRSNAGTLQFIASTILPNLKIDFLGKLPYELGLKIVRYLDIQSICRSARVSKCWRKLVDSDVNIWKSLFNLAGFKFTEEDMMVLNSFEKKQKRMNPLRNPPSIASENRRISDGQSRLREDEFAAGESRGLVASDTEDDFEVIIPGLTAPSDPRDCLEVVAKHTYKYLYRRHHIIRRNWMRGRCSSISFEGHSECVVTCLQFDSDKIVSGTEDFDIHIYDTKTGSLRKKLQAHNGGVWALQYYGNTLVTGSTDRTVRIWDIERGINTHTFRGHSSTVRCLQILIPTNVNPDQEGEPIMEPPYPIIVTGSRDSTLRVWRLPSSDDPRYPSESNESSEAQTTPNPFYLRSLMGHAHSVRAIAAYGNTVVSGSYDCTVRVWNVMNGECKWRLEGHTQKVYSVVIDKDRNRCISGSMDCSVRIWSLEHGTCIYALEGHSSLVGLLSLTPNHLVSAAADATLRVWDPDTGTCRNVLSTHTGAITCFQHDDQKVISGSETNLKMWDIKTGKFVRDLLVGLQHVWQVQFDERRCVAAVQRRSATWFEVFDFGKEVDVMVKKENNPSSSLASMST